MTDPVQTAASQDDWLARFDAMSPDEQEEQVFALGSADADKLLAIAEHAADDMSVLRVRATLTDDSRRDDVVVILSEWEDGLPKDERVIAAL